MRRLVYIALLVAIVPWIVIGIVREATDDDTKDHYFVRAVFDNASTLVAGEDVKVAGVAVGVVSEMDVTEENKAAVVLRIDEEAFTPFKQDANCVIRLQGLIGERFVECEPGTADADELETIDEGDGEGEYLLPVENTSSPVDLDLVNDVMRRPYRERFAILLSELGTGLAGRGEELNEVIHRANPALQETEDVVLILSRQNRQLARLAKDSDEALAPLTRERARVSNWIVTANETGEATAERREDIRRGINLLPSFLRELRPLMRDLEGFADDATPVVSDLNTAAPALGRLIKAQGDLADAGRVSFPSLGDALERGRPALIRARPLIQNLGRFAEGHQARLGRPRLAHEEHRPHRRGRAHRGPDLLPRPLEQRLRRDRALPARRPGHQHLLGLLPRDLRRVPVHLLRSRHRAGVRLARGAQRAGARGGQRRQRGAHRRAAQRPARRGRHPGAGARARPQPGSSA